MDKYINIPQLIFARARATISYLKWARGTGKSEGPICNRMYNVARYMPKSNNFFAVPSYQKFIKDLLPAIRKGLLSYNLREFDTKNPELGGHWCIGVKPPSNWEKPIYKPDTYENVIYFANGTIYSLFSQDSKMKNQGNSLISGIADESKLINKERLNEDCLKAMRGGREFFGKYPEFNSQLYTSDGFLTSNSYNWFNEAEKYASNEEMDDLIRLSLHDNLTPAGQKALDYARKNTFFYLKASGYDNRFALGWEYFKRSAEMSSSPMEFLVSHLNYDMNRVDKSFYRYLDETRHGRYAMNESYLQNLEFNEKKIAESDCRADADLEDDLPLDFSFDFGGDNSCAVVCQYNKRTNIISLLKDFVEPTYEIIISQFNLYYNPRKSKNRKINLWYDVDGTKKKPNSNYTYVQEMKKQLESLGWQVNLPQPNIGYLPHSLKYKIWDKVLDESSERDKKYPKFRYNRVNAKRTALSMGMAPVKEVNGDIRKDKSSETNKSIPYDKATHLSDAVDNPVCFTLRDIITNHTKFIKL